MILTRRRAFTLIELMIAIGVIIVLASILVLGLHSVTNSTKRNDTKVTLANLRGMLDTLESTTRLGSGSIPAQWYWVIPPPRAIDPTVVPFKDMDLDFWKVPYRTTLTAAGSPAPMPNPGLVKSGENARTGSGAVLFTEAAMSRLLSAPANASQLQAMPANKQMKLPQDSPLTTRLDETQYPLILDGWGNPIIFVPASGLSKVKYEAYKPASGNYLDADLKTVTSTRVRPDAAAGAAAAETYAGNLDRPFFASAGPDGDFSTGDDNVYSFEN